MSRSKDAAAYVGAGRGSWRNASRAHRCPVCGHDSWCSIRRDGAVVACRRDDTGIARTDREGVDYWVHVLDPATAPATPAPVAVRGVPRAPVDVLDAAYCALLAALPLSAAHAEGLRRRGLDDAEVRARGYRTLPLEGRSALARELASRVGERAATGVPGLYVAERDGRTWWSLAGSPGLLVPVRDARERVVALKVRRDDPCDGPRYTYVSSAHHGGAAAAPAVHVPLLGDAADCTEVRVTEGELKADVATVLSGVPTVSLPGVGSWRAAAPAAAALGARRVRVAFDADHRTKPEVGGALALLVRDLARAGFEVAVERWDARHGKGIDDVLAAGRSACVRVVAGAGARDYGDWIAQSAEAQREARKAG
jgi:hypothetical protein